MAELTQEQIDALVQEINEAEDPESVTNEMVATVFDAILQWVRAAKAAASSAESAAGDNVIDSVSVKQTNENLSIEVKQHGRAAQSANLPLAGSEGPGIVTGEQVQKIAAAIRTDGNTSCLPASLAPATILASMGLILDNVNSDSAAHVYQPAVDDYYFDPASNKIKYVVATDDIRVVGDPNPSIVYTNRQTGLCYRWKASNSTWVQVAGNTIRIINDFISGGDEDALSAEKGAELYTKTRVVIDSFEYDSDADSDPSYNDVGEAGLLLFDETVGKLFYFYQTTVGGQPAVSSFSFFPDPHVLYCDGENGTVLKWDGISFETVASGGGGGMGIQINGTKLIFTVSQGGGDIDVTPVLTAPSSIAFADIENGHTGEQTFVVKGKNLTDNVVISSTNSSITFKIGSGAASQILTLTPTNGKLNGNTGIVVTAIYTPSETVSEDTSFSGTISVVSDGADSKSISFSGRQVPQIVPLIYFDETDATDNSETKTITGPLSSDSDVADGFANGATGTVRAYVKNIEGTVTAEIDATDDVFSLDDGTADPIARVTELTFNVSEDGYIDIPVRLPRQSATGNVSDAIELSFDGNVLATIALTGTTAARKTSGVIFTDTEQKIRYEFITVSGGTYVQAHPNSDWNTKYSAENKARIVLASSVVDANGYTYKCTGIGNFTSPEIVKTTIESLFIPNTYTKRTGSYGFSGVSLANLTLYYSSVTATYTFNGMSAREVIYYNTSSAKLGSKVFGGATIRHLVLMGSASLTFDNITEANVADRLALMAALTEEQVANYNAYHNLSEGDDGALTSADVGKRYIGKLTSVTLNGVATSIPYPTTVHYLSTLGSAPIASALLPYFKFVINDADTYVSVLDT